MKAFMDKDFLLETDTAKHLFHHYAEQMPLVDYHCHISPREIYENRRFNDLVEVWLGEAARWQLFWRPLQVAGHAFQRGKRGLCYR